MARLLCPVRSMATRSGTFARMQVAGGGTPTIVKEASRHPSGLAGSAPRRAPAANGDAVAVEDEWAVGVAACPPSCQRVGNGG